MAGTLAEAFESFAEWCVGTSPLYEQLARGVAREAELLELAGRVPEGKSPPHLLLAGVHALLLAGTTHPLRQFYGTCVDEPRDPTRGNPVATFRSFALGREAELVDLFESRRTQTNAVRRSAALYPAFEHLSRRLDRRPLALVELGPSAGLNLAWDRYAYDYGTGERYGAVGSPVTVPSELRGDGRPPLRAGTPPVADRVGIDVNPLDVTDPADVRWLRALVWPEHRTRHRLLREATELLAEDPPPLREADAVEDLPAAVSGMPEGVPVCLFDTQVRYQLDETKRERLGTTLRELAADRELFSLSGRLGVPDERALGVALSRPDGPETRLLDYEQHRAWIRWYGADA